MSKGKPWDLTSTRSLSAAARWIRKGSDALLVLVIRPDDVAFDADPRLAPMDAINTVRDELPSLLQHLIHERAKRTESRGGAKGEAGR